MSHGGTVTWHRADESRPDCPYCRADRYKQALERIKVKAESHVGQDVREVIYGIAHSALHPREGET